MSWLTSLGLCLAGLVAIIIEFFVPAAGIIGVLGLGSIVGGIVVAYRVYGTVIGSIYLIGAAIATPAVVIMYFKLFPKSFVGRWLILGGRKGASGDEVALRWPMGGAILGALILGTVCLAATGTVAEEPLVIPGGVFGSLLGGFIGVAWAAARRTDRAAPL